MKTLTDQIFEIAKDIIQRHPEVSDNQGKYEMADDGGVEVETGEFLYGLVRALKPAYVLTTGIYTGISDLYIGLGLKHNGFGKSDALECIAFHLNRAKELWAKFDLNDTINAELIKSLDFTPTNEYDLIFLDTEPEYRFKELVKFFPYLKPGGYVFIHDLHRHLSQEENKELGFGWPFGKLPDEIIQWFKEDKLRPIHLPTPRGLSGFYKPHERDFKWQ